jgi:hypothetical protein
LSIGTIVVPRLVDLINDYLEGLYQKHPHFRGEDGWLFRPYEDNLELQYMSMNHIPKWVAKIKPTMDFLDSKRVNKFQFKNSRIFVHNSVVNEKIRYISPGRLLEIASLHMRHYSNGDKTMGQRFYTEPALFKDYFNVMNSVFNFPWDIASLDEWLDDEDRISTPITSLKVERKVTPTDYGESYYDESTRTDIEELEKMISVAVKETKRGPGKGKDKMHPAEYLEHVEKWSKEIKKLERDLIQLKKEK